MYMCRRALTYTLYIPEHVRMLEGIVCVQYAMLDRGHA